MSECVHVGLGEERAVVTPECGYCGRTADEGEKWLPLECGRCRTLFHLGCLRGTRPPALMGDQLFQFTCSFCDPLGEEQWNRPNLLWVHVIHLALYNLMMGGRGGRSGFFRWNEDICGFIQANWQRLMPHRRRTQSWHSTIAGTLSVHCPNVFRSGFKQFGEHGWWSLTRVAPPDPRVAMGITLGKRSSVPLPESVSILKRSRVAPDSPEKPRKPYPSKPQLLDPTTPTPTLATSRNKEQQSTDANPELIPLSQRQEDVLREHLSNYGKATRMTPKTNRLLRKLKVRNLQRNHGHTPFNLDEYMQNALSSTVKYIVDESRPYYDQILPATQPLGSAVAAKDTQAGEVDGTDSYLDGSEVLERLTLIPVLSRALAPVYTMFEHFLSGGGHSTHSITSPYTARALKPYIFRSTAICPLKPRLLEEIVEHCREEKEEIPMYIHKSTDFCYLHEHHLPAVNALVSHFFWPVDLSECLQYPDFTVVVLHGKLVVGCGFMTPDVKINEAYISFLVVHPDFRRAGIGKLMLYHLIQTCMGKDVTLHVSVDNPAMLLYQSFGFKAEQYCIDFYTRYYPLKHHLSKHAYFMRLRR